MRYNPVVRLGHYYTTCFYREWKTNPRFNEDLGSVIIALISLNVNVYSVDLLDVDTHQEQFIWLLAIFAIWITVFVMSNNLIVLFFC